MLAKITPGERRPTVPVLDEVKKIEKNSFGS